MCLAINLADPVSRFPYETSKKNWSPTPILFNVTYLYRSFMPFGSILKENYGVLLSVMRHVSVGFHR